MTWTDANHEADRLLAVMLERIAAMPSAPTEIQLTDYEDATAFGFLRPGNPWPFAFWQSVNRAVARKLRRRKLKVRVVTLRMADYFDWLARFGLSNTTENRAQFITWMTAPEPKPIPQRNP